MEVNEIQNTKSLANIQKKESVREIKPSADRLVISSESDKKALWVDMLKAMPDIRLEKIEATRAVPSSIDLAQKMTLHQS